MMDLQRRSQLDDAEVSEMTLTEVVELMRHGLASANR